LDFLTGQPTGPFYPRAKIIDMIGYIEGGVRCDASKRQVLQECEIVVRFLSKSAAMDQKVHP
jgi:hypothetical protein